MMSEVGIGEEYTREAVGLQDNQDVNFLLKKDWQVMIGFLRSEQASRVIVCSLHKLICGFHNMSWNSWAAMIFLQD